MEEVSLEQLLEGRERPATMAGTVRVPMEDVEELGADEMVPLDDNPLGSLIDEPASKAAMASNNGQIAQLEQRVRQLEGSLKDILKTLGDLTTRVKNQIGQ
jgi:hypothetical protein